MTISSFCPTLERKAKKVNFLMSSQIIIRGPTQCHTHHQKMMNRHKTIKGIIAYFERLFESKREKREKLAAKLAKIRQKALLLNKSRDAEL